MSQYDTEITEQVESPPSHNLILIPTPTILIESQTYSPSRCIPSTHSGNLILRLRKVGARLGQGLGQGPGKVWARLGQGWGKVRTKSKVGARSWLRSGQGLGKVGARLGQGPDKKQGSGKVWAGKVWARFGQGWGKVGARSGQKARFGQGRDKPVVIPFFFLL